MKMAGGDPSLQSEGHSEDDGNDGDTGKPQIEAAHKEIAAEQAAVPVGVQRHDQIESQQAEDDRIGDQDGWSEDTERPARTLILRLKSSPVACQPCVERGSVHERAFQGAPDLRAKIIIQVQQARGWWPPM